MLLACFGSRDRVADPPAPASKLTCGAARAPLACCLSSASQQLPIFFGRGEVRHTAVGRWRVGWLVWRRPNSSRPYGRGNAFIFGAGWSYDTQSSTTFFILKYLLFLLFYTKFDHFY
jgi:hypothetical protein